MKTSLDCIPCFARQALDAARFVTDDPEVHEEVVREVLRAAAEMDLSDTPPAVGQRIHRRLREITGVEDPYRNVKDRFNRMALEMLPDLRDRADRAKDPLPLAARLAIAGNVIDFGVRADVNEDEVRESIGAALEEPFFGEIDPFREAVSEARSILYLADNAGEIVFDRLLIERLPLERTTVAVRGGAVINDATRVDAEEAGLTELVEVIENGSDAPGTILSDCSQEFRERFRNTDLIIAKGQGNYETLSQEDGSIFFLFKVKCPVIAAHVELPVGTHVLLQQTVAPLSTEGGYDHAGV
jgi:uncharacterized protein with ATP-grasp and redox domains